MDLKHLIYEQQDEVALLKIDREDKRNALNDELIESLHKFFSAPPAAAKVVVIQGKGKHFCAGLDLTEHKDRDPMDVMFHSQRWHETFRLIEFGRIPVISALQGAVIGGGLELCLSTHVRVAEPSAFYSLPEGRRGIFVGGGASVRVSRAIGLDRTREMMLTGRRYTAEEGEQLGLCHYLVEDGECAEKAMELARNIACNAEASNYMMLNALAHIDNMPMSEGLFTESLAAALAQTSEDAKEGMRAFLDKRAKRF